MEEDAEFEVLPLVEFAEDSRVIGGNIAVCLVLVHKTVAGFFCLCGKSHGIGGKESCGGQNFQI